LEDDYEKAQANLVMVVSEKSKLESEIEKLREFKDESEQKEVLLSSRLNEAKKKEANKSTAAGRLEAENEALKEQLEKTKAELDAMTKAKAKVESNMEKLKAKAVERVKQAETALAEERELNEERKRKMKTFVESKAEELREAKESVSDMQVELQETRTSLRSSREREESFQKELEASHIKYRELQRDMERLKRSQEEMHKMGSTLEHELEKSASETEEHKKKRMSAKHELMTMVRTLEVEKSMSGKLRESIKFTFTPKALSQQQLLTECLKDFEVELEKLATKLGKTLPPQSSEHALVGESSGTAATDSLDVNGAAKKLKKNTRAAKADNDTERLISNLEHETQHVSKGIMSLAGSIERMRSLINEDLSFNCMAYFSNVLAAATRQQEARHHRLGDTADHDEREETVSITSFDQGSSTL
jgi:chromosome segregation ATPase